MQLIKLQSIFETSNKRNSENESIQQKQTNLQNNNVCHMRYYL